MISQRSLIGITAIICVTWGLTLLVLVQENSSGFGGILIRMGIMLGVIWLAMPSLVRPEHQRSLYLIGVFFVLALLVAARPRIFVPVMLLGVVSLGINWLLKRIAKEI